MNQTRVATSVSERGPGRRLPRITEEVLFRIAQELLTNVIRHANAQRVQISLQEERGALVMTIDDDGRGITEQDITKPTSFGLRGIRERVDLIGGELTMKGVPHRGTTVGVRVPILQQR